jgi:molybdate transport system substrate-binding protein
MQTSQNSAHIDSAGDGHRAGNKTKGALVRFSNTRGRGIALVTILALCVAMGAGGASAKTTHATAGLTIFAGSSMTTVLPQIDPGNTYSFGSSTTLGTQIANGAPADVLMSANTTEPALLYSQGVVEKPVNFTRNTLAIVVPKSNPANIDSIYDLTKPGVKVDVAAPSVPVGAYTVQVLNQMGLNTAIQANVVSQETSDANVVAKVALGQVDAGFVYLSDFVINPTQLSLVKVPAWAQPKITYAMAVVTKSPNQAAAQAWINTILSTKSQATFVKNGFLLLTAPTPAIAKITPAKARIGKSIVLTGKNFTGATSVTFHGVPAKFKVNSIVKLTVTVPAKAKTGSLTVTTPNGTATWKLISVS